MQLRFGTNFAVFVLFFGIALVEALRSNDWLLALLFATLGLMSLWAGYPHRLVQNNRMRGKE